MKRIYSLNHGDLDGIAAALAVRAAHPGDHVETAFADYSNVDRLLLKALTGRRRPDRVVLADISFTVVGKECEDPELNRIVNNDLPAAIRAYVAAGGELVVLDHHPGALEVQSFYGQFLHPDSICETKDSLGVARAGSEQAARYYFQKQAGKGNPAVDVAIREFCELAGDYDVWRDPFGFGGTLAMAAELMFDPYRTLEEFETLVRLAAMTLDIDAANIDWPALLPPLLKEYAARVPGAVAEEKARAIAAGVVHSPRVTEIFTEFFPSIIGAAVYDENQGVCVVRYSEDREKAHRGSLRSSKALDFDCGAFCAANAKGGGHVHAAGFRLKDGQTFDAFVQKLVEETAKAERLMVPV